MARASTEYAVAASHMNFPIWALPGSVDSGGAVLVNRRGPPGTAGILIRPQPSKAFTHLRIFLREPRNLHGVSTNPVA